MMGPPTAPLRLRAAGAFVIDLPYNMGIGGALRTGYKYARQAGYDRAQFRLMPMVSMIRRVSALCLLA